MPGTPPVRVDVRARGEPHAALDRGAEVGQHVHEEVRADHDVERLRARHEVGGRGVDQDALELDLRIVARDIGDDVVPEHERVPARVRLRHARELAAPPAGELERVARDPLDSLAREHVRLDPDLVRQAPVGPPADPGVLALGVLAHAQHVDLRRAQRALDPGQQPDRAQVHVLVEHLADRQQEPPERHVVGHVRRADGADVDGVVAAQRLDRVRGHHRAGLSVVGAPPRQLVGREREAVTLGGRAQDVQAGLDDLDPHAVSGDHGDPMGAAVRHGTERARFARELSATEAA